MKSVGIDIGSSSIKVLEITTQNKKVYISHFYEKALSQNPAFDPEIEILEFLRDLGSQYDPANTKFAVALRQEFVSTRLKQFPFSDRQKILKSLPFELEEDLPFSADSAIYDAKTIRTLGSSAEVLAVAAPKNRIQQTLDRIQSSGVDISILSAEALALSNNFESWNAAPPALPPLDIALDDINKPTRRVHAVVHIGHTRTLVLALENKTLLGVRSIFWGAKNIAEAISRRYEIPYIEAVKEMRNKAFVLFNKEGASYDQVVFSDTISNQIRDLGRELKISLLEFNSEFNGELESVQITGGGSHVLNMNTLLTQILEVPVNRQNQLTQIPTAGFEVPKNFDSIAGVALGLAIDALKKPRNPAVNFLKQEFAKQNQAVKIFFEKWTPSLKIAAAAFVVFFIYTQLRESFTADLISKAESNAVTLTKPTLGTKGDEFAAAPIKRYISDQQRKALQLQRMSSISELNSPMDVVKRISESVPPRNNMELEVRNLKINDEKVYMEGFVKSTGAKESLKQSLAKIAMGPVTEARTRANPNSGTVAFAFEFNIDRGIKR